VNAKFRFDLVPLLNGGDPDPTEPSEARRGVTCSPPPEGRAQPVVVCSLCIQLDGERPEAATHYGQLVL